VLTRGSASGRRNRGPYWRPFRDIEFPLISPTFFFVVLTTVLFVNNEIFGMINVLTQGALRLVAEQWFPPPALAGTRRSRCLERASPWNAAGMRRSFSAG
jgi:hypothetical protein